MTPVTFRSILAAAVAVAAPWAFLGAQPPAAPASRIALIPKDRHAHVTPERIGTARTAGGNIDVSQPRDDTLIVSVTGVAVAGPHPCKTSTASMQFDLNQTVEIVFPDDKIKKGRLTMEANVIGLLRGDKNEGAASLCDGSASIYVGDVAIVGFALEGHAVAGESHLSVNDRKGPVSVPVRAGDHRLSGTFRISASHARGICGKAASAEFAPDPALDPTWISVTEPFKGVSKKDFGFKIIVRVEPE